MCVDDGRGYGLVVDVLFSRSDSFEEDLRWEPNLGVFVDLVELDDEVNDVSVTLLKIPEALRGAFSFSTSVELNTKGAGGVGTGSNSNKSLPLMLTPEKKNFCCFCDLF